MSSRTDQHVHRAHHSCPWRQKRMSPFPWWWSRALTTLRAAFGGGRERLCSCIDANYASYLSSTVNFQKEKLTLAELDYYIIHSHSSKVCLHLFKSLPILYVIRTIFSLRLPEYKLCLREKKNPAEREFYEEHSPNQEQRERYYPCLDITKIKVYKQSIQKILRKYYYEKTSSFRCFCCIIFGIRFNCKSPMPNSCTEWLSDDSV